jgi:DNA-binding response OmpR family regulator
MAKATVLIVENDAFQRRLYTEELQEEGYEVWQAMEGREALRIARERRPDVVVLDLQMPEMDGLDTLSRLLSVDRTLPVIIYSAYSCYQSNFLSWLAQEYLLKSSDLAPLKATIRKVLAERPEGSAERRGKTLYGSPEHYNHQQIQAVHA